MNWWIFLFPTLPFWKYKFLFSNFILYFCKKKIIKALISTSVLYKISADEEL